MNFFQGQKRHRFFGQVATTIILLFTMLACGGGGGGGTPDDLTPNGFTFTAQTGIELGTVVESNAVTVSSINKPVSISVTGGEYSIAGRAYTSAAGEVSEGQSITVRLTSSDSYSTQTSATLIIGGVTGTFSVTTLDDITPDAFSFTAQTGVALSTVVESNEISVAGISVPVSISITGGEYSIDDGAYASIEGTVTIGQTVKVKQTSSASYNTQTDTVVTIGDTSDTFSVTSIADTEAPTVVIVFPPAQSLSDSDSITIRGTATDNLSGVSSLSVNGVATTTTDNFANWSAVVPLVAGMNTLTVSVSDAESNQNTSASESIVESGPYIVSPNSITLDATNNRALLLDSTLNGIIAVDLSNGARSVFSDALTPDDITPFTNVSAITLDTANNRALVIDDRATLISVNLVTGERSVFSSATIPDSVNPFVAANQLALDSANNQVLVMDYSVNAIIAVDLTTGARTILSNNSIPDNINPISYSGSIVVDSDNNRALISYVNLDAIYAVDLTTGARTIMSDSSTPDNINALNRPDELTLDSDNNRLLVIDETLGVVAVDLTSGARTILSNSVVPDSETPFLFIEGIVLDSANDRALVIDDGTYSVTAVDLTSGVRTILSDTKTTEGNLYYDNGLGAITFDIENNRALVIQSDGSSLVTVDLDSGEATIFSNNTTPNNENAFSDPKGLVVDDENNRVLVTDSNLHTLLAVDLDTGARTILSDDTTPDNTNLLWNTSGVALDSANNRALVINPNSNKVEPQGVIAVDLTNGARTVLSGGVNSESFGGRPELIDIDADNNRALVVDNSLDSIFAVDLTTSEKTIFSDPTTPDITNSFQQVEAIAIDSANNRALVTDSSLNAILAVDLTTGARTLFDTGFGDHGIAGIAIDPASNTALVTVDSSMYVVYLLDLVTGQKVILSR